MQRQSPENTLKTSGRPVHSIPDDSASSVERPYDDDRMTERILVLTPLGRDADYTEQVLRRAGLGAVICTDLRNMCELVQRDMEDGSSIGVLLIAEEALTGRDTPRLMELLRNQPPWSDLPIIVFTSGGAITDTRLNDHLEIADYRRPDRWGADEHREQSTHSDARRTTRNPVDPHLRSARVMQLFESGDQSTVSGSVTLLERPVHTLTLVSAIQGALRARRRQWQLRELLGQREQLLAEARTAREEAELANRTKDQFLATLSHELRTPLNAILGWTQLLGTTTATVDDASTRQELHIGIETIERNARTQAQLIEDLLDVSRIVSGKLRLDVQQTDVHAVLHAAVSAISPTATARGVHIEYNHSPQALLVAVDPARLQQIVWNLLSNAVKFTNKGGVVALAAACDEDRTDAGSDALGKFLHITVHDNGIGIDEAFLPFVFDRFRQADGSTTRRQGGLGLGLSIVKQLVELHHGHVRVQSEGIGHGATFSVMLPLSPPSESAGANGPVDKSDHLPTSHHGRSQDQRQTQMSILVVDDEADARNILLRLLQDHGHEVRVAESVDRAVTLIEEAKPDVIISDISMPDRDGFDLLHEIRNTDHEAKNVPVIALTAYASGEDRERILEAGFTAHLSKPLDASALQETLRKI